MVPTTAWQQDPIHLVETVGRAGGAAAQPDRRATVIHRTGAARLHHPDVDGSRCIGGAPAAQRMSMMVSGEVADWPRGHPNLPKGLRHEILAAHGAGLLANLRGPRRDGGRTEARGAPGGRSPKGVKIGVNTRLPGFFFLQMRRLPGFAKIFPRSPGPPKKRTRLPGFAQNVAQITWCAKSGGTDYLGHFWP